MSSGQTTVGHMRDDVPGGRRVDRGTPWGNPFRIGLDGDRAEVIEKYRGWFAKRIEDADFRASVLNLRGQRLLCWCHPEPCHADVIAEWLNEKETA